MASKEKRPLEPWRWDKRPRVLLIGNGFNRTYHMKSWKNLIESVRKKEGVDPELLHRLPLSMQVVLATGNQVGESMEEVARYMRSFQLTKDHRELLEKILDIPARTILTTNYSYELEKVFSGDCGTWKTNPYRLYAVPYKSSSSVKFLHRYSHVDRGDDYRNIWHIHGEVDMPSQIIMGHYYYGKMEFQMQSYIPGLLRRYKYAASEGGLIRPRSWIDYYLMGDVYIAGFGLDLSEADIWYLACCKNRHFPEARTVYYTPVSASGVKDLKDEEKAMMEAYGIEVREREIADTGEDRYGVFYRSVLDEIAAVFSGEKA